MSMLFERVFSDMRGYGMQLVDQSVLSSFCRISTICMRLVMTIRGIQGGKGSRFWGCMLFRRAPQSKISIGRYCGFRSTISSNLVGINHPCAISTISKEAWICIGDRVGLSGTVLAAVESITIKDGVGCGANTVITDFDWHPIQKQAGLPSYGKSAPIVVEENVWLGMNVVVLKGVTIGKNSVIGANSVVTKSIPPNVLAAGNPCRVIRQIER